MVVGPGKPDYSASFWNASSTSTVLVHYSNPSGDSYCDSLLFIHNISFRVSLPSNEQQYLVRIRPLVRGQMTDSETVGMINLNNSGDMSLIVQASWPMLHFLGFGYSLVETTFSCGLQVSHTKHSISIIDILPELVQYWPLYTRLCTPGCLSTLVC